MNEFPLVLVHWDDAWGDAHDSVSPDDTDLHHRATQMVTVGWLIRDDERGVSLFSERCDDPDSNTYRGRTFIPRAMITEIEPVIKPRKPRKVRKPEEGSA